MRSFISEPKLGKLIQDASAVVQRCETAQESVSCAASPPEAGPEELLGASAAGGATFRQGEYLTPGVAG